MREKDTERGEEKEKDTKVGRRRRKRDNLNPNQKTVRSERRMKGSEW